MWRGLPHLFFERTHQNFSSINLFTFWVSFGGLLMHPFFERTHQNFFYIICTFTILSLH